MLLWLVLIASAMFLLPGETEMYSYSAEVQENITFVAKILEMVSVAALTGFLVFMLLAFASAARERGEKKFLERMKQEQREHEIIEIGAEGIFSRKKIKAIEDLVRIVNNADLPREQKDKAHQLAMSLIHAGSGKQINPQAINEDLKKLQALVTELAPDDEDLPKVLEDLSA